ncbi:MAG: NAD-dependent epimerase/dehydratase family protein [Patescibacteria group bacterium]
MPNKVIKKTALTPTVLISGGTGFLGARLAETLLEQNSRVVVVDLLSKEK